MAKAVVLLFCFPLFPFFILCCVYMAKVIILFLFSFVFLYGQSCSSLFVFFCVIAKAIFIFFIMAKAVIVFFIMAKAIFIFFIMAKVVFIFFVLAKAVFIFFIMAKSVLSFLLWPKPSLSFLLWPKPSLSFLLWLNLSLSFFCLRLHSQNRCASPLFIFVIKFFLLISLFPFISCIYMAKTSLCHL